MAKNTKETFHTIHDPGIVKWLHMTITYLWNADEMSGPEQVEQIIELTTNLLREWTETMLINEPVIRHRRKLIITGQYNESVTINWYRNGLIQYDGDRVNTLQIEGTPYEINETAPADNAERLAIIQKEAIAKSLNAIFKSVNTGFCSSKERNVPDLYVAYTNDRLIGSHKTKLRKPDPLIKSINEFKEALDHFDDTFIRYEDVRQFIFDEFYKPDIVKEYVIDCAEASKEVFELCNSDLNDDDQFNRLSYDATYAYRALHSRRENKKIRSFQEMLLDPETKKFGKTLLFLPGLVSASGFSNLVYYFPLKKSKEVLTKYHIPDRGSDYLSCPFMLNLIPDLCRLFPEIFTYTAPNERNWQKIGKMFPPRARLLDRFENLNVSVRTYVEQFTTDGVDGDKKSYVLKFPSQRFVDISAKSCNVKQRDYTLIPAGYRADETVDTLDHKTTLFTYRRGACEGDAISINLTYGEEEQGALKGFWTDTITKLILSYLDTNKFDDDLLKEQINNFLERKMPTAESIEKRRNWIKNNKEKYADDDTEAYSYWTIPAEDPDHKNLIEELKKNADRMLDIIEHYHQCFLKADDPEFIEWCVKEKFISKKEAETRLKELEEAEEKVS